jgi:hypothetical protein
VAPAPKNACGAISAAVGNALACATANGSEAVFSSVVQLVSLYCSSTAVHMAPVDGGSPLRTV